MENKNVPDFIPFAWPDIGEKEEIAVLNVLRSGWLTTGAITKEFEANFANAVGAKHAIAVNSATAAMHLALEAIELSPDDEVIVPTYTFAATAEVVRYFNAKPVLVDVYEEDFNIDVCHIERAITPKTKAIIPVHIAGVPANLNLINDLARKYQLTVIEDAAHAFPCKYNNQVVGSISDFTCFSFYATKTITTAEGGMLCTNNDKWAERARVMSLHGISKDAWKRYAKGGSWRYDIIAPGYKYNLTDIASALGLVQLSRAEEMRENRSNIARKYKQALSKYTQLQLPIDVANGCLHSWHLYMLRLNLEELQIDRDKFIDILKDYNIGCSVHFIPLHLHSYYKANYGYKENDFPIATRNFSRELSLPLYSKMTQKQVEYVCDSIKHVLDKFSK